ncbi:MAG: amidase [Halobacteriaceae archaeon]
MPREPPYLAAPQTADAVRRGDQSAMAVLEAHLDRLEGRRSAVNAWITVTEDLARETATAVDEAVARGEDPGPLAGLPVGLKDLSAARAGVRHTFGCTAFADNVADTTSAFVDRLEAAGAVVLGKTNLPEFGHRPKTDNYLVGPTSTPFDLDRNAGGSSGGSAAAVADAQAALAQGGDAGGSVRIPSAFCGVVGHKPSFGRVPNPSSPDAFGAHSPFTDRGIHARTTAGAARMLDVMAGPHPGDPFSLPDDGLDATAAVATALDGGIDLDIAYSPDLGMYPVDPRIEAVVEDAVYDLREAGASVDRIQFDTGYSLEGFLEATRFPTVRVKTAALVENLRDQYGVDALGSDVDAFPETFRTRAERGFEYDAVTVKRADNARTTVYEAVVDVFSKYDLLATPTTVALPFPNDEPGPTTIDGVAVDPLAGWFPTFLVNLTGHPAASVPAGLADGLPVGLQLVGHRFADDTVLAACRALEAVRPWADAYPWA